MILLSRAEEIILLAAFKRQENAYGVTIREQIHNDLGRNWSFGVIYRTLKKTVNKGYVNKIASAPLSERGGRSRYYYRITAKGLAALGEIRAVQTSIWEGVTNIASEKPRDS